MCAPWCLPPDSCFSSRRDGRLQENDQILAINGSPLDKNVTQQQAIGLLQQSGERVDLVVARDPAAQRRARLPGPVQSVRKLQAKCGGARIVFMERVLFRILRYSPHGPAE